MAQKATGNRPVHSGRKIRKLVARIVVGILIFLVIVFFGVGTYAATVLTKPARVFDPALNPGVYGLEYEEFMLPARDDGLQIAAWYIPSDTNQRVIILVHGRDNSRTNGFVDLFVSFASELHKAGFSVMMIDLRGHGESADSRYYFGVKERLDVLGAVDWLLARGFKEGQIGVLGYSLGAGSVIGAASQEQAISAIWLDSAFADVKPVIERSFALASGLPKIFLYPTQWMVRILYGYDIMASRPIDDIGKIAPRPIFMAHCKKDGLIPISNMDQLLAVAQNTQTWIITECDQSVLDKPIVPEIYNNHAIGYYFQPEVYNQKVIEFFNENLK